MFRFIGIVAVVGLFTAGALWSFGYCEGDASAKVTPKGRQALNEGIDVVRGGLDDLKTSVGDLKTDVKVVK